MEAQNLVEPKYALGSRLLRVADLVAASPTFRQQTGTDSRETALKKIELAFLRFKTPQEVDAYYGGIAGPAAVIEGDTVEWGRVGLSPWQGAMHLRLLLVDYDRYPENIAASLVNFCNFLEGTTGDVVQACPSAELPLPRVSLIMPTLDNARRAGQQGGHWLGGADLMWEALAAR